VNESTALSTRDPDAGIAEFELNQRRAKAYSESGYWPDASKVAQALVKIEAGASLVDEHATRPTTPPETNPGARPRLLVKTRAVRLPGRRADPDRCVRVLDRDRRSGQHVTIEDATRRS
jgi:hypothetical protein